MLIAQTLRDDGLLKRGQERNRGAQQLRCAAIVVLLFPVYYAYPGKTETLRHPQSITEQEEQSVSSYLLYLEVEVGSNSWSFFPQTLL